MPAPADTLLDKLVAAGGSVYAVGKIADIFAHRGITKHYPASGLDKLFAAALQAVQEAPDNSLVFVNFVDFDSSFGHRRDVEGYGEGLEYFDDRLPELLRLLKQDDLLLVTADHGCDPTIHVKKFRSCFLVKILLVRLYYPCGRFLISVRQ